MNLKELKEIIDIVISKESIEELELEKSGVRLRIKRASNHAASGFPPPANASPAAVSAPPAAAQILRAAEEDLVYIKSPIVGTFYKAASPNSDAFVSIGDFVEKG